MKSKNDHMTMANPVLGKDSNWLKPCPTGLTTEELKALKNVWELNQIQIYPPVFLWLCFSDSKKKKNNVELEVWFLFWLLKSIWVFWEGHKNIKKYLVLALLKALVVKNSVLHNFSFGKVSQIHETFLMELQLFGWRHFSKTEVVQNTVLNH